MPAGVGLGVGEEGGLDEIDTFPPQPLIRMRRRAVARNTVWHLKCAGKLIGTAFGQRAEVNHLRRLRRSAHRL